MSANIEPSGISFFSMDEHKRCEVNSRMQPGGWSQIGFLKNGQCGRELSVLDKQALERRGVTYEEVAAKLDEVVKEMRQLSIFRLENETYKFQLDQTKGSQTCPFSFEENDYGFPKDCADNVGTFDLKVIKKDSGEELSFSGLHPHLIRVHGFFEDGPYRVDPEKVCDFFNLGNKT